MYASRRVSFAAIQYLIISDLIMHSIILPVWLVRLNADLFVTGLFLLALLKLAPSWPYWFPLYLSSSVSFCDRMHSGKAS